MLAVTALVMSTGLLLAMCGPTTEPDSTVPATTELTTSTTSPATTTTTPSPAAGLLTVLVPLDEEQTEVVNRLYAAKVAEVEAFMDPDAAGIDASLDDLYARGGEARGAVEEGRSYYRDTGYRVRLNEAKPWELIVESVALADEPFRQAQVQLCFIDSLVMYEPGGSPSGSDAVVNDDTLNQRTVATLVIEDGQWQLLTGSALSERVLGESCPPAE